MDKYARTTSTTKVFVYHRYQILNIDHPDSIKLEWFERFGAHAQSTFQRVYDAVNMNKEKKDILILPTETACQKKGRSYEPFLEEDLYTELAKLDQPVHKKILKFVNHYGLPIGYKMDGGVNPIGDIRFDYALFSGFFAVENIKKGLLIREAIADRKDSYLRHAIKEFTDICGQYYYERLAQCVGIENKAQLMLTFHMEITMVSRFNANFGIMNQKIVPIVNFWHLFELANYQFIQSELYNKPVKKCKECHALFELNHAGRKFCAPLPPNKRSTCENTFNQRNRRLQKRQKVV